MSKGRSLSIQLFFGVLGSLLAAVAVFFVVFWGEMYLLEKTVYGYSFMEKMAGRQFERLQNYVVEEAVTPENLRPLDIWCGRGDKVYLVLYQDGQLLYESYYTSLEQAPEEMYDPAWEDPEREYALVLSDGTQTQAFLYYYVGDAYYYWAVVLSGFCSFLVFSFCFISFVHRKLRYIQQLKNELDILAGGDLSYQVTVRGNDELGELAEGLEQMRRSIAAHQAAEERMRLANSELVTAMSHDLRTPLTSLLAYLELMERGKYENEEQLSHFIRRSLEKTMQIKTMADQLFEYVLVYSSEWEPQDLERRDGDELLCHLVGEHAFSLENQGFQVEQELKQLNGQICVNLGLLRRVFDNLYANLLKYADLAYPVEIRCWREENQVYLSLRNRVSQSRDQMTGTNIGLSTCEKILSCHGGSFSYWEENGYFQTQLTLPVYSGESFVPEKPEI